MLKDTNLYFASINTSRGFRSDFQSIFNPSKLDRVIILKGGPGTGKSSLMKSVAATAREKGYTCQIFLCSSDPNSLDGVLIPEISTAIIDGTAPHTTDPEFPGVVENIVNLGNYWHKEKLKAKKEEILALIRDKGRFYRRAYQFLSSYGEIMEEIVHVSENALLGEKMEKNIRRQASYFFRPQGKGEVTKRNLTTVCREGICQSAAFSENSERIWIIEDHLYSSHLYLNRLLEIAKEQGQNVVVSTSPLDPAYPNALYFPDSKTSFVTGTKSDDSDKVFRFVNMKRFLDPQMIAQHKQKLRFGEKCLKMLLEGAVEAFRDAAEAHAKLEHFYIDAMDFRKVEKVRQQLTAELFENS